ncbi:LysM peptidoglycan-binding domain-containing protein, partial [Xanthomonas sp. Kuri4-3]
MLSRQIPAPSARPSSFARPALGLLLAGLGLLAPAVQAQDWHYRVRPGDTLWDLGERYLKPGLDWQRLGRH